MDAEKEATETSENTQAAAAGNADPAAQAAPTAQTAEGAEGDPLLSEPPEGPDGMDEACRREISVEIPAEVVSKGEANLVKNYSRQARIPGFRKGKVPPNLVRNRFFNEIHSDLMESLVPQYFREAVINAGLRPVSQPFIYDLHAEEGQPVRFKAVFEVLPEFELGDYRGLKVEKPEIKITDEEVESELRHLQERQASFDPVDEDRGANEGEFSQVSFTAAPKDEAGAESGSNAAEGEQKGEPKKAAKEEKKGGAKGEQDQAAQSEQQEAPKPAAAAQPVEMNDVMVEIGGANTLPEFSENLKGVKPGEERTFDVAYPENFHDPRLAGKTFVYHVKVTAIKKKTLPELNDDFAKELNQELETLDLLKKRMRENMETQQLVQAEQAGKEQLMEKLLEKHEFTVPRALVEHQIDMRLERGLRALAAQGMRTEDMKKMDFKRLRAGQRAGAIKEVKSSLLLARIAEKENIQVSDEEMEHEIGHLAEQMKQTPEQVKERLTKEGALERIRARMRTEKALDFLYSKTG